MNKYTILKNLPKPLVSRLVGKFVSLRIPILGSLLARAFAWHFKINLNEAEKPWWEYPSIQDLFTRKLKLSCRSIAPGALVHPADSRMTANGKIERQQLLQAKGKSYTLRDFTLDQNCVSKWEGGYYITYYLCPTDYHRVHSPVDGEIVSVRHIVGDLWPVNDWSVATVNELFVVNERVNIEIRTAMGPVLLSMVGATNVGQISLNFDTSIRSNVQAHQKSQYKEYNPPLKIYKGDEVGTFHMGSTVVMLYPPQLAQHNELAKMNKGPQVKMGEALFN